MLGVAAMTQPALTVTHRARSMQPGELVVLTVASAEPVTVLRATAFGRDLRFFQTGDRAWQVLAGIDLDIKPGAHVVTVAAAAAAGMTETSHVLRVVSKSFPTRRLSVAERYVDPPADVQKRIADEAALLGSLWSSSAAERLWEGPFLSPVPQKANSVFGSRSIFNGQARTPHGGADFPSPALTPVAAPNGGRVTLARDLYFTGQTVVIDHGVGLVSLFAHLSRIDVAEGSAVATGQTVGLVGATGRVTGAHLHWTLRADGARVDPLSLLAVLGKTARDGN
jgi:murein DD-endopeptidase MepM/ murein hydrolase activator NlpD